MGDPAASEERDWFGFPVQRPREPVPCPRCERTFTDRVRYAEHLRDVHGVAARPVHGGRRAEQPALGRNPRGTWSRRLRSVPLVLVLATNVALITAVLGALAAVGPPWWDDLMDQSWSLLVVVPMLWPTILFLTVRGVD